MSPSALIDVPNSDPVTEVGIVLKTAPELFDEITTYFKTTKEYHYIPNLKDGIYPLTRPTSEQLAALN